VNVIVKTKNILFGDFILKLNYKTQFECFYHIYN